MTNTNANKDQLFPVVGIAEVADMFRVERNTVDMWLYNSEATGAPEADGPVGKRRAWYRKSWEKWARETGRGYFDSYGEWHDDDLEAQFRQRSRAMQKRFAKTSK